MAKKITCNNKNIKFFRDGELVKAYIAEKLKSKLRPYSCRIHYISKKKLINKKIIDIKVIGKKFQSETLNVPKKTIDLSKKDIARYFREKKRLIKVYRKTHRTPLFNKPFTQPLNSFITSAYGKKRIYNNKKESQHSGIDFRAKIGLPIPVANNGKIVFADDLFFTGNTVIVDHGIGIFTIYAHMNKIKTVEGEYVPQGAIIGLAGATGRVSGPHLHWGVKLNGKNVNGFSLIQAGR